MKTLTNIYNVLDSFVTAHPIWSAVIIVAVLFWLIFIITLIVNRKAIVEDLDWHK